MGLTPRIPIVGTRLYLAVRPSGWALCMRGTDATDEIPLGVHLLTEHVVSGLVSELVGAPLRLHTDQVEVMNVTERDDHS